MLEIFFTFFIFDKFEFLAFCFYFLVDILNIGENLYT